MVDACILNSSKKRAWGLKKTGGSLLPNAKLTILVMAYLYSTTMQGYEWVELYSVKKLVCTYFVDELS